MTDSLFSPFVVSVPDELDGQVDVTVTADRVAIRPLVDITGAANRRYATPTVHVDFSPVGETWTAVGFASTQFALPVRAGHGESFDFAPADNLASPPVVNPLLLLDGDRVELLAPVAGWHEQVIAIDQTDAAGITGFRWGWHGDLDQVPAGFEVVLGRYSGGSVAEVIERWGAEIQMAAGTARPSRRPEDPDDDADPLLTHLSYWTDNGAAYWYRTEPGQELTTTLVAKIDELEQLGLPVRSVELDSWFYRHEISRPVSEVGYLDEVPPTGMMSWTPRPDVLPDGVDGLRRALGDRPLTLHSRHISPESPYLSDGEWWVDKAAHPVDQSFFQQWCRDAASWGATCIEQDWMMVTYFWNRSIREAAGRALEWQRGLDTAAIDHDVSLLWCMALPGDFAATVELDRVVAIRTSDDYRYAEDPALLWVWYLTVNSLADALGLAVFKDCFLSSAGDPGPAGIDGDPHAELEALLSAMSAGVVGLGDRLGHTDVDVVRRVCRGDGRLVTPDRAIRLTDRSFADAGESGGGLCWAETESTNEFGTWRYLVAINTSHALVTVTDQHDLGGEFVVYDWRAQTATSATSVEISLDSREWALFVICPIEEGPEGRRALIGDPLSYATMAPTRIRRTGDLVEVITEGDEPERSALWWFA